MNMFSLLFVLICTAMLVAGICLFVWAIAKGNRKWAVVAIVGPFVGCAIMVAAVWVVIKLSDIRLRREVANAEVIGTWTLREESLKLVLSGGVKQVGDAPCGLEVRADGSCRYRSFHFYPTRIEDLEGRWTIRPTPGEKQIYELSISTKKSVFGVSVGEENGRLFLWEYLGDPDEGAYLKYDKQPLSLPR